MRMFQNVYLDNYGFPGFSIEQAWGGGGGAISNIGLKGFLDYVK